MPPQKSEFIVVYSHIYPKIQLWQGPRPGDAKQTPRHTEKPSPSQDLPTERGVVGGGGRATTRGVTRGRPGDALAGAMKRMDISGGGDSPFRRRELAYVQKVTRPENARDKRGM